MAIYEDLKALFSGEEGPELVLEVDRTGAQVVRAPALDDGSYCYDGAVFSEEGSGCRVLIDCGRQQTFKTLHEAWSWFNEVVSGG